MEDAVAQRILECFEAASGEGAQGVSKLAREIRRKYPQCPLSNAQLEGAVVLLKEVLRPDRSGLARSFETKRNTAWMRLWRGSRPE